MIRPLPVLFVSILFTMCNPAKQEASTTSSTTTIQQKDTVITEQPAPAEQRIPAPALTLQVFEEIPGDLQAFLNAVHDPSKLADYISSTTGCYIIEEGPGVYPVVTEVKTTSDFSKSDPFTLFLNTPKLYSGYYINNESVDPCNLPAEGIFFFDAKSDHHLLLNAYQSQLTATNEKMTDELKTKLNALDAALIWYGAINLPGKNGELNTFDVYLALIDNKVCLAAIDTRGCGI